MPAPLEVTSWQSTSKQSPQMQAFRNPFSPCRRWRTVRYRMECIRTAPNRTAFLFLACVPWLTLSGLAQETNSTNPRLLPEGFSRVSGQYVDLITDMPLNQELQEIPVVFDLAIPKWCEMFSMDIDDVKDWHGEVFVMLERQRFVNAGLIPAHLPEFPYGFQSGDQMWVSEQPSTYYRRHLVLHEGTHWFMNRKYGRNGPPWLMEGMAEWLGTHRWDGDQQQLSMGIVPEHPDEVPYWGRVKIIQEQLAQGDAPSIEDILKYGNTAHREVEAYAWSWAVVIFLKNHPRTQAVFDQMLAEPMRSDLTLAKRLFQELRSEWSSIRQEWNAMISELEYGYDPSRGFLTLSPAPIPLQQSVQLRVSPETTWQASGLTVTANQEITLTSDSVFYVGDNPRPWKCTADGVTLEYYRGQPLGKLSFCIVGPIQQQQSNSTPLKLFTSGAHFNFTCPMDGEIHFRVNESNLGLRDNSGVIQVQIAPATK
jgi:hypothetical protein